MKLKNILFICISLLVIFSQAVFADQILNSTHVLFVQSAGTSTLKAANPPGSYILTLNNVDAYVDYFSQRPKRVSGVLSMSEFIKTWHAKRGDSFSKDAPNAMLRVVKDNKHYGYAVELTNPVYDEKNKTLTYTVRQLQGEHQNTLPENPMQFGYTGLFIDDFCPGCIIP